MNIEIFWTLYFFLMSLSFVIIIFYNIKVSLFNNNIIIIIIILLNLYLTIKIFFNYKMNILYKSINVLLGITCVTLGVFILIERRNLKRKNRKSKT